MARTTRNRTRLTAMPAGYQIEHDTGTIRDNVGVYRNVDSCADSFGRPIADSNLSISHTNRSGLVPINGIYQSGQRECNNYYNTRYATSWPLHAPTNMPSVDVLRTQLLARTNPNRPGITPLTLLQDLKELPRMLKDVGRLMFTPPRRLGARDAANAQLVTQFGWVPFIKDIHDLLNLQRSIAERQNELRRLYSSQGLKRTLTLGNYSGVQVENGQFFASSGNGLTHTGSVTRYTKAKAWGTIRWKPNVALSVAPDDQALRYAAQRTVTGITNIGLMKGLWDVIPWTWLIGWFTNVSDYAIAVSDQIPCSPTANTCVMVERETRNDFSNIGLNQGLSGGKGYSTLISRERFVSAKPSISIYEPFIGPQRLSILSALAVQKLAR